MDFYLQKEKNKSLQKKKTHIAKQIKNFKKEIIYFQSTTEDLKKQK